MKYIILGLILFTACTQSAKEYDPQELIDDAISAHGMNLKGKKVTFTFRDRAYAVLREEDKYTYTRSWQDDSLGWVHDILVNSKRFTRLVNGDTVTLDEEWISKYSSSVNSVLYFFQVPFVLNDPAAIKKYVGEYKLKGQKYLGVQVTFSENGGGEDHEDVFLYWIHPEKKTIDFFAYSYLTEGGGVRFREAINRREFKGLIIQDYINYKAENGTFLKDLPRMFEEKRLEELSLITNENVRVTSLPENP